MLAEVNYRGPLITDTGTPGETKRDGVIPAHPGGGCLRASRNRWIIFFATLDPNGWDCSRSILYQLRADRPDGPLVKEGVVEACIDDWDPLERGDRFFKGNGMPVAFGVPRGAIRRGKPMSNANLFVVKWWRHAHLHKGGHIHHPYAHPPIYKHIWPEGPHILNLTLRVEWMQFRLNDREDDIEVLAPPRMMRQRGFETGEAFCELGPNFTMNHSMKAPCPVDDDFLEWMEMDTFVPYARCENAARRTAQAPNGVGARSHIVSGGPLVAAVRYRFNQQSGLYEWVQTGRPWSLPGRRLSESTANRLGDDWIIAFRSSYPDGATCWFRTDDPLHNIGRPTISPPDCMVPRTSFFCADGTLRLFMNDVPPVRAPHERTPLCCWDVSPKDFSVSDRRVILDARKQGMPFYNPFVDMAKLCPHQGRRQLLLFRVITRRQTADQDMDQPITAREHAEAGIHYAELVYREDVPEPWRFAAEQGISAGRRAAP